MRGGEVAIIFQAREGTGRRGYRGTTDLQSKIKELVINSYHNIYIQSYGKKKVKTLFTLRQEQNRDASIVTSFLNKGLISCDSARTCTGLTREIKERAKYGSCRAACSSSLCTIGPENREHEPNQLWWGIPSIHRGFYYFSLQGIAAAGQVLTTAPTWGELSL